MHRIARCTLTSLALVSTIAAQAAPVLAPGAGGRLTPGDAPLVEAGRFTGNLGVAVAAVPYNSSVGTSGVFDLSGIPAGSNVVQAWLYVTAFPLDEGSIVQANFQGTSLGGLPPTYEDPQQGTNLYCSAWRFDVTPLVAGDGAYAYGAAGHINAFGDALVVVYHHPSLPVRTIAVHDGAEGLRNATTSTTFADLLPGNATLTLFTEADNPSSLDEESVVLNGVTVAGPADLFDSSLGNSATLLELPVTTVAGANVLDVTADDDWFGLHLAILSVDGSSCTGTATATFRNSGANPASLTTGLPQLGSELSASVDLTTTGHSFALLAAYAGTLDFTLPGGQVLLQDITDPSGELLAAPVVAGPIAEFTFEVPADPNLCGFFASFQALHFMGVTPFALSNAQDLTLGL